MSARITSVDAVPIRLPRDLAAARGTAGSPTALAGAGIYRWSTAYPVLYSTCFETAIVRVGLDDGLVGWGEAQAPLVPEVACTIVEQLLAPAVVGAVFDGSTSGIRSLWERMDATMRVRGQSCGFLRDAMSGVDLALWDLAGKRADRPVSDLLAAEFAAAPPAPTVPAYLSGVAGRSVAERAAFAARHFAEGIETVKLYYDTDWHDLLAVADALPAGMGFAVDGLWHLPPDQAVAMARDLDARDARWLECPLDVEDAAGHDALAAAIRTPLALGESYRTLREARPFFGCTTILQPDLGRSGLTGSLELAAAFGGEVMPHVSIAMGPQIAAAVHLAAALAACRLCEFNPAVLDTANAFLAEPLVRRDGGYVVPTAAGLGVAWNDRGRSLLGEV
jgi:D-galactarolactone cycloisomerase